MNNRNKKLRNITVNNKTYKWLVGNPNCDGDGGCIFKVWNDEKNLIYSKLIHGMTITPKLVSRLISMHLQ